MTDTFSSGSSTPHGTSQNAGDYASAGDVTSTLAELERKLRELEHELTSIGRRRMRPEAGVAEPPPGEASREIAGRLVDERVEPVRPTAPVQPPTPPRVVAPPPPSPPPPAPMAATAVGDGERARPTEAQLASLAELRRFRERLERFTKELLADYDAVLSRAMYGVSGRIPSEPAAAATPPPPPKQEEALFEGRVELGVGPFYDIGSLSAFEQTMATVPHVIDVSVRRFEASHAVVDLRLAAPVALASELHRVLDTDFSIRQVAAGRIVLTFDEA